jgi:hypothetical protein
VQPGAVERTRAHPSNDALGGRRDAGFLDLLDLDPVDRGLVEPGIAGDTVALADLDRVAIVDERPAYAWPPGQQRLAAPGRQREVHPRRRAEPRLRVVVAGMREVAVAVDVDEPASARPPQAGQAAEHVAAVATDDDRQRAAAQRALDLGREREPERAQRDAVAHARACHRLRRVRRAVQPHVARRPQRVRQPRRLERGGPAPGPGLHADPERPQAEVTGRLDQVEEAWRSCARAPRDRHDQGGREQGPARQCARHDQLLSCYHRVVVRTLGMLR